MKKIILFAAIAVGISTSSCNKTPKTLVATENQPQDTTCIFCEFVKAGVASDTSSH